ncbi:MAG TPA: F0F1 ATP synthase subunit B [Candidatus Saccharimonadales bacterium]|nr:F0F1 ATP synthase subunit B [Candidatus Saccharimonadales bacterium]
MANAGTEGASKGFFEALGIDWTLLVIQTVAFLVLLWFLAKFVYPPLSRMLEKREADIEAGVKAAHEAEKKADAANEETSKLLKQARKDAAAIVATAKEEAAAVVSAAESKSKERADRLIEDAEQEISKSVEAARKTLHNETIELVAQATEKVIGKAVDAKVDDTMIKNAIKEAK